MGNAHRLTEGALFLAIFAVLLLMTLYLPVIGVIINLFLALPFIMFAAKYDRKSTVVFLIGAILISLVVGTLLSIPLTLSYGLTGVVIGDFIRERKSRLASYISGSIVFLITLVVEYAITVSFFEIDIIKDSIKMLEQSLAQSIDILKSLGQAPNEAVIKQFETGIQMMDTLIPSLFVISSLVLVLLIQLVSFPIAKRFGVEVLKWKPFRQLTFPKSLLWYYLIAVLISVVVHSETGTYWYSVLINVSFILQLCMLLQGLSFVFFITYMKKLPSFIPILTAIFMFIIPIVLYIIRILGIIDLGFDLRKRVENKK
jgi:uncharacterized protein YybS (DUF2232 family)